MELYVEEIARRIESMEVRGAHRIAQAAAGVLAGWAESGTGAVEPELELNVERLVKTRPTAVSLRNAIAITLAGIERGADAEGARGRITAQGRAFIQRSRGALEKLAEHGAGLVKQRDTVMTICNSTAAIGAIVKAHQNGGVEMVYSLETRPRRQGMITVSELARAGVPVTLIVDSAARMFLPRADIVLVGADSVLCDGSLANKIGTSQVAAQAHEMGIPFYSCAESYKFHPGTLLGEELVIEERGSDEVWWGERIEGVLVRNPSFDVTPPEHVRGFVTERGVFGPLGADAVAKEILEMDTYGIFTRK